MTGAQVREARRLLGWSSYRLAGFCSVSAAVIRAFETKGAVLMAAPTIEAGAQPIDRLAAIRSTLEEAGIEFENEGAAVVCRRQRAGVAAEPDAERAARLRPGPR